MDAYQQFEKKNILGFWTEAISMFEKNYYALLIRLRYAYTSKKYVI